MRGFLVKHTRGEVPITSVNVSWRELYPSTTLSYRRLRNESCSFARDGKNNFGDQVAVAIPPSYVVIELSVSGLHHTT